MADTWTAGDILRAVAHLVHEGVLFFGLHGARTLLADSEYEVHDVYRSAVVVRVHANIDGNEGPRSSCSRATSVETATRHIAAARREKVASLNLLQLHWRSLR